MVMRIRGIERAKLAPLRSPATLQVSASQLASGEADLAPKSASGMS